jgi:ribosome maturation factor RimP
MDVAALVRPIVEHDGFELVEAAFQRESGRRICRVTVDADGGVDLEALSTLSEKISRRLDLEDLGSGRYELEVSSPGIERPLTSPKQFARAVGSRVKVKTAEPVEGARSHEGVLLEATQDHVILSVDGGARTVAMADIASARTVADWNAELKRSTA